LICSFLEGRRWKGGDLDRSVGKSYSQSLDANALYSFKTLVLFRLTLLLYGMSMTLVPSTSAKQLLGWLRFLVLCTHCCC